MTLNSEQRKLYSFQDVAIIIGLEVHVQLQTQSKLFCGCATVFGTPPNQQTCPVCVGMPGTLPVLNRQAIQLAIRAGTALNCQIATLTKWDRKHYFYPDLPKGYQTSQYDQPICGTGYLDFNSPNDPHTTTRVWIERAHLEEDAGKSLHDEGPQQGYSKIDLNRAGTPLLEIVTKPDLRSAQDAKIFLQELRLLLTYIQVSDCNMQEGSLRCDANVNLHIPIDRHQPDHFLATPIVEIKNLNSFRAIERAIDFESQRQFTAWKTEGLTIDDAPKQTRGWNDEVTVLQREKEDSSDYRYFPCPDLIGYQISQEEIQQVAVAPHDLPAQIRKQLETDYQVTPYDAQVMVGQGRGVVDYFLAVAALVNNKKMVANWVIQEVLRHLNDTSQTIEQYPIPPTSFAELLGPIERGIIDQTRGKEILNAMISTAADYTTTVAALGIVPVSSAEIIALAQALIEQNPAVINQVKAGNAKAIGALIGKAKQMNPNANPGQVKEEILKILSI